MKGEVKMTKKELLRLRERLDDPDMGAALLEYDHGRILLDEIDRLRSELSRLQNPFIATSGRVANLIAALALEETK